MKLEDKIKDLELQNQQMQTAINELKEQLTREKSEYKLPRIENGIYYYITHFQLSNKVGINATNDNGHNFDKMKYDNFDYFTDKNKAQKYADHIKLELELFQMRDIIRDGWIPDWDNKETDKHVIENIKNQINFTIHYYSYMPFAFETAEKMKKFIELVGLDKIMKYLSF